MGLAKHTAANVAAQAEPIKINQDSSGLIRTHQPPPSCWDVVSGSQA